MEKYEEYLEDVLKKNLEQALESSKETAAHLQECQELQDQLAFLENQCTTELDTSINLGCDVYAKAHVPNSQKVFVDIGLNFFLEMDRPEAIRFLNKKEKLLEQKLAKKVDRVTQLKADVHNFIHLYGLLQQAKVQGSHADMVNVK